MEGSWHPNFMNPFKYGKLFHIKSFPTSIGSLTPPNPKIPPGFYICPNRVNNRPCLWIGLNINCVGVLLILTDISCCSVNNPDLPTLGPARQWVRVCLLISHLGINWTTSNPFLRTPFLDSLSQNWEGYKMDNKALSQNTFLGLCLDKLNSRNTIS